MGILTGKKILITGVHNKNSIALGIANMMHIHGAKLAFVYQYKKIKEKIKILTKKFNSNIFLCCDLSNDKNIEKLFFNLSKYWKKFDGIVHCIAYADKFQFSGDYLEVINEFDFQKTNNISSYSFVAMAKFSRNMLKKNACLITISYLGSNKVIPFYNVMGVAKASLEANVRYVAHSLGKKSIRVNAISPGPIKTLSSFFIKNFNALLKTYKKNSSFAQLVTVNEIGNIASFLCSNLSLGITGQIIYVDNGLHTIFPIN